MLDEQMEAVLCDLAIDAMVQGKKDACFNILSNGMRYAITTRDKIHVRRTEPSKLKAGDIVVYERRDGDFTVHRVIGKKYDGDRLVFITKPDAYSRLDPPVYAEQIVGKVIAIEKPTILIRLDTARGRFLAYLLYHISKPSFRGRNLIFKCFRVIVGSARTLKALFKRTEK
jgi:signal peptidase I